MIIYDNRDVRFILCKTTGSVLMGRRVLVPAALSTVLCMVLVIFCQTFPVFVVSDSVSKIYATILGFVIVFRTNMAFGRFFEGVTHMQMMFSKFRDVFTCSCTFLDCAIIHTARKGSSEQTQIAVEELLLAKARMLHWCSLLSALAVQELQKPRLDFVAEGCDVGFAEWNIVSPTIYKTRARNGINPQAEAAEATSPRKRFSVLGHDEEAEAQAQASISSMEQWWQWRRNLALSGPEFDDLPPQQRQEHASFMTRAQERGVHVVGDLTELEAHQVQQSSDTVLTVVKWMLYEVSRLSVQGKMLIHSSILSRTFQEMSQGLLAFFTARVKIAYISFPFPFAQVLSYALVVFYILCPLVVMEAVTVGDHTEYRRILLPLLLNFATCVGYGSMNEIAVELEEPFGFGVNNYPIHTHQQMIMACMEETYFTEQPTDFSLKDFEIAERSPEVQSLSPGCMSPAASVTS